MTSSLLEVGKVFEEKTNIKLHYAGLPFIRTVVASALKREMNIFLIASALVTGVIMFVFFRSFPCGAFFNDHHWYPGDMGTGNTRALRFQDLTVEFAHSTVIVTIGVTNAIYLLNKYHLEYFKTKDKMVAITKVVRKMGLAMFLTNLTGSDQLPYIIGDRYNIVTGIRDCRRR
jgi:predicted RND superfamily exporter protein